MIFAAPRSFSLPRVLSITNFTPRLGGESKASANLRGAAVARCGPSARRASQTLPGSARAVYGRAGLSDGNVYSVLCGLSFFCLDHAGHNAQAARGNPLINTQ